MDVGAKAQDGVMRNKVMRGANGDRGECTRVGDTHIHAVKRPVRVHREQK